MRIRIGFSSSFFSFSSYILSFSPSPCLSGGETKSGFYNQQERSGSCYITQCPLLFPPLARRKPNWVLFWTQIKTNRPAPNASSTKVISFAHFSPLPSDCEKLYVQFVQTMHRQRENCAVHIYYSNEPILFSFHPLCSGIRLYKILYKHLHKTQLSTLPCFGRLARGRGG